MNKNRKRKLMWGITLIILAVLVVINSLGLFENVGMVGLIISVLLIPVIVVNLIHMDFAGFLFPLAIIGIIYDKQLGIEMLTPIPILVVALLLSVGLSFIFPKSMRNFYKFSDGKNQTETDEVVNIDSKFSGVAKYVNSKNLKRVNISSTFAGTKLFLDKAVLAGGALEINLKLNFSGVDIYVPSTWHVVDNTNSEFFGYKINGIKSEVAEKTVYLNGSANFAGVTVIYL